MTRARGMMMALQVETLTGPEGLRAVELPEPATSPSAVILDVEAAGVGFVDTLLARGRYQVRPDVPFVPGLEVAGIVRTAPVGSGVMPGQRAIAHVTLGGFAQTVRAEPDRVAPLPEPLSFVEGAAMVVNHHSAHFALTQRAGLEAGETVLVHGAGGGLGTACVQVAAVVGARVLAVAGTPERRELAARAGAETVYGPEEWFEAVRAAGRADVIVDPIGGERFEQSVRCLARGGRLVTLGFTSGRIPQAAANRLLLANAAVVGSGWREALEHDRGLFERTAHALANLVQQGIRPLIGGTYPLAEGARALQDLESRTARGKLVLEVG